MRARIAALLLAFAGAALGQAYEVENPDPVTEARLKGLAHELRCLVCQNQTIADSNAPLAVDLRQQIRTQIAQGRSDAQIRDYMVERYGDFVLYRPPLKGTTAVLWAAPFVMIAIGIAIFFLLIRRRRVASSAGAPVAPERREQLAALLEATELSPTPQDSAPKDASQRR